MANTVVLTPKQVRREMDLSEGQLYRLLAQGAIPGQVKLGGKWYIRREPFENFMRGEDTKASSN